MTQNELESVQNQLPSASISVSTYDVKTKEKCGAPAVCSKEVCVEADELAKKIQRRALLAEQYRTMLAGLDYLKIPCIVDFVSIMGDSNAKIAAQIVANIAAQKVSFCKEVNDSLRETIKVIVN